MKITSLELMEKIVSSNKDLSWDGWTVLHSFKSDKGRTSKYGVCVKGTWYIQTRFNVTEIGWNIPEKLIKYHG